MAFVSGDNGAVFYTSLRYKVERLCDIFIKAFVNKRRVVYLTSACSPSDLSFFLGLVGGYHEESDSFIKILSSREVFSGDGNLNLKRAGNIIKNDLMEDTDLVSIDYSWVGSEHSFFRDVFDFDADMHSVADEAKVSTTCFFNLGAFSDSDAVEIAKVHTSSLFESHFDEAPPFLYNSLTYPLQPMAKNGSHMQLFEAVKVEIEEQALTCGVSVQEKRVLEMMLRFKSNKVIAGELFISDNTLKQHLKALYRKLSVDTRLCLYEKFYGPLLENSMV